MAHVSNDEFKKAAEEVLKRYAKLLKKLAGK